MKEKRRFERSPDTLEMDIKTPAGEIRTYTTLDISDGGIFVLVRYPEQLVIGTEVIVTPTQHAHDNQQPTMRGRVARRSGQGMGIEFLDLRFT